MISKFKKLPWQYALGELTLIFFGITGSLYFDRWNEEKKEREVEKKLLKELSQNLNGDLYTLEVVINSTKEAIKSDSTLIALRPENKVPTKQQEDEIRQHLPNITDHTSLGFYNSAYIAFQNAGLNIISNDSIRLALTMYNDNKPVYLYAHDRLTNQINQRLYTIIENDFKVFIPFTCAIPWDLSKLIEDRAFWGALNRKVNLENSLLTTLYKIEIEVAALKKLVDAELDKFES